MSSFSMDQMFDYFVVLTSKVLKISFDSEEVKEILSSFTKRFSELFEKLNKEGQTIIMVTHDQRIADRAGRIIKLADGKVSG